MCFSFSFRENLTFIATIACVTSNMLCLPSTVPPERNLTSWTLLCSLLRNCSRQYGGVLSMQVGKIFVSHSLGSPLQSSCYGRSVRMINTYLTQHTKIIGHLLFLMFLSLSFLIGLPMSRFHVCNTYNAWTSTLSQRRTIFSQAGQRDRSICLGYGDDVCESL